MRDRHQINQLTRSYHCIYEAFKNDDGELEPKLWRDLITAVFHRTLARRLKELIADGYIIKELGDGKSRGALYRWNAKKSGEPPVFHFKDPEKIKFRLVERIHKKTGKRVLFAEFGRWHSPRSRNVSGFSPKDECSKPYWRAFKRVEI